MPAGPRLEGPGSAGVTPVAPGVTPGACAPARLSPLRLAIATSALGLLLAHAHADAPANRLARESSPYLRQHAHNPVDWYPWGEDAFARARAENKPVFLSIGYSTCHWCHRMGRESFSDPEIARLLNEHFVCIKIDREERPDIDRIHQAFVEATTGAGGWPLTVWLTPDLKPFFGGTYFPPDTERGRPGLRTLTGRIAALWAEDPARVRTQSERALAALRADTSSHAMDLPPLAALRKRTLKHVRDTVDPVHGGFGSAPKFPEPSIIALLLNTHATATDPALRDEALGLVHDALRALTRGALHDTIGGGFHRYAVDAAWRVPHFEKMLYDQAQIASVCLDAWRITGDTTLRDAALHTLDYLERRLAAPGGGYYSAEDADSAIAAGSTEKREGAFYVWTADELNEALGPELAALFAYAHGVEAGGNVPAPEAAAFAGTNILHLARTPAECAAHFDLTEDEVNHRLRDARARLHAAREMRPRPHRDEKIITAWNGLALSALARATQLTGDTRWSAVATRTAVFLREHHRDPATGRLLRSSYHGAAGGPGFAEDHAFLIQGLLDLYETTFDTAWLDWAATLQEQQDALFWDESAGGYFSTDAGDASVVLRLKDEADGVEPAAGSIAVANLARLAELLHRESWRVRAEQAARSFGGILERDPAALPRLLAALGWLEQPPQRLVIAGEPAAAALFIAEARRHDAPYRVVLRLDSASRASLERHDPSLADYSADSDATAYLCANYTCDTPALSPSVLGRQLAARAARAEPLTP